MSSAPVQNGADRCANGPEWPKIRDTHTGLVAPVGNAAYEVDKPIATNLAEVRTLQRREKFPVVVGVNGSAESHQASLWAGAVAERLGVPLHVVTAARGVGHEPSDLSDGLILQTAVETVHRAHPSLLVTTAAVAEPAPEALAAASRGARLLVVGCDDVSAAGAVLVGSTTLATLADSTCPVVAWRGVVPTPTDKPIVVGFDGSGRDSAALGAAIDLASRFGASLQVIYCWPPHLHLPTLTGPPTLEWDATTQAQWRHLEELIEPWRKAYPGVDVELICGPDKPGRALLLYSACAQLVVIGSRRRDSLTCRVFGSTGMNLLHHCAVPVMLCPIDVVPPVDPLRPDDHDVRSVR